MLSRIGSFFSFAKKQEAAPDTSPVVWSDIALYTSADFPRYNPDDLIGRRGHQVYKTMMFDEQLKAVVLFRRNAVTSRGWGFQFDDDMKEELSEEEQDHRIKVLRRMINRIPGSFRKSLNGIMTAQYNGFSIVEKTWDAFEYDGATFWGLKSLDLKPFDSFYFNTDEYGRLRHITQDLGGRRQEIDQKKIIHYVQNPELDPWYGQSELRAAYRDYFSKDILTKLENIYLERMAGGLVWAEQRQGANGTMSAPDSAALQNVLANIQTKTGIKMPKDWELHVEGPRSTDAFERAINRHDRGMAKALLMPNMLGLTDQGNFGGFSQSQTQQEGFLWMLDSEAADLEECLNEQLFKEACEYNWGDGIYPSFYFKPLSKVQQFSILDVWNKLITSGAVEASDTDEDYVRELMDFPQKGVTRPKPVPILPGQQPEQGDTGDTEGGEEDTGEGGKEAPGDTADTAAPQEGDKPADNTHDHTFFPEGGRASILYKAFTKAQRRVDFAAIERGSTMAEWQGSQELGALMAQLAGFFADTIREEPDILNKPETITKIKVPKNITSELKKVSKRVLSQGWELGVVNAKRELEKAGMGRMSKERFAKFASVGEMATKFFEAKSFQMAGNLSAEALKEFQTVILNGIKFSKPTDDVIKDLYSAFARKGMITEDDAKEALGVELNVENPSARLDTTVRTSTFEAINEARFDYFSDPDLGGFVTAMEYSAILDGNTTAICEDLEGRVYPLKAGEWEKYRPPNHFNCRSLLVPVTERDEISVTTDPPRVEPAEGFK